MSLKIFVQVSGDGSDDTLAAYQAGGIYTTAEEVQEDLAGAGGDDERVVAWIEKDTDTADALADLMMATGGDDSSLQATIEDLALMLFKAGMEFERKTRGK